MEIVVFDLETSIPTKKGEGFHVLEFGAFVVEASSLKETGASFETLVHTTIMPKY